MVPGQWRGGRPQARTAAGGYSEIRPARFLLFAIVDVIVVVVVVLVVVVVVVVVSKNTMYQLLCNRK